MKINCDYCGASIDISKNKVCPHCGASYADDQELINNKKREEEIRNIDVERKKLELENQKIYTNRQKENEKYRKKSNKTLFTILIILAIPGLCLLCCCIAAIPEAIRQSSYESEYEEIIETPNEENETIEEVVEIPVSGGFNEPLSTSTYTVTITELKKADVDYCWKPDDGYMYVSIYFEVENITDKDIYSSEKIYCSVNGIMVDKFNYGNDKYIKDSSIPKGMKIGGYMCFEVPIDAKEFVLTYGEYLTFTIPNTLE